jgi:hypothetical protein
MALREAELEERATCKSFLQVRTEGPRQVSRKLKHYSLPLILAVGYRVRSIRGTQFRQWATERLTQYLVKGFVMDDERLKSPPEPGVPDYFDEILERIRDIRSAERRMYLQVRNVFALAADYQPSDEDTQRFFQIIQNKLHFAAAGKTAPELIADRADRARPNMGLTSWKGDVVRKTDVTRFTSWQSWRGRSPCVSASKQERVARRSETLQSARRNLAMRGLRRQPGG